MSKIGDDKPEAKERLAGKKPELDLSKARLGYEEEINEKRRHHEIYLGDPRKIAPEKRKTVIRHPVKERGSRTE